MACRRMARGGFQVGSDESQPAAGAAAEGLGAVHGTPGEPLAGVVRARAANCVRADGDSVAGGP
jgi:hypothetical protein